MPRSGAPVPPADPSSTRADRASLGELSGRPVPRAAALALHQRGTPPRSRAGFVSLRHRPRRRPSVLLRVRPSPGMDAPGPCLGGVSRTVAPAGGGGYLGGQGEGGAGPLMFCGPRGRPRRRRPANRRFTWSTVAHPDAWRDDRLVLDLAECPGERLLVLGNHSALMTQRPRDHLLPRGWLPR